MEQNRAIKPVRVILKDSERWEIRRIMVEETAKGARIGDVIAAIVTQYGTAKKLNLKPGTLRSDWDRRNGRDDTEQGWLAELLQINEQGKKINEVIAQLDTAANELWELANTAKREKKVRAAAECIQKAADITLKKAELLQSVGKIHKVSTKLDVQTTDTKINVLMWRPDVPKPAPFIDVTPQPAELPKETSK